MVASPMRVCSKANVCNGPAPPRSIPAPRSCTPSNSRAAKGSSWRSITCRPPSYPMMMSTGRVLYHWHGGQMTRRAKGLMQVYGEPLVELNPNDAERLGVNGNKTLRITSRRGSIVAQAWVTDRVPPGMVYANFHFPQASANELTLAALDPVSKIPEYKVTAVKVELVKE